MAKPIGVIAGDKHFNLNTLEVAEKGTRMAINKANELNVPFISNGDMLDQKAQLRAEYVNALIEIFKTCKIKPYINVGNHSRINERAPEHALNFLKPYAHVIETPTYINELESYIIPYDHDPIALGSYLKTLPENSRLIMHQGIHGSLAGEYILDKSAIDKSLLANFRTILSHYHTRQDIKCGRPRKGAVGLASYIGNLYTLNFAEANDPPKGFQILMDDGTLQFVPTNLRKHVVLNVDKVQVTGKVPVEDIRDIDLVKVKYTGTKEELSKINKQTLGKELGLPDSYKLELIPLDTTSNTKSKDITQHMTQDLMLDTIIDSMPNTTGSQKERLKTLWRNLCE